MVLLRTLSSFLVMALLTGCVSTDPLDQEQLQRVRPMALKGPAKPVGGRLYSDATSGTLYVVGSQTGLVGALLFGGIAAANQNAGVKRFEAATRNSSELVLSTVLGDVRDRLIAKGYMKPQPGGELGKLKIDSLDYGVAHAGDQRFTAVVAIRASIEAPGEKTIWRGFGHSNSLNSFSKDEVLANPKLYRDAVIDAARKAAVTLTDKM